MKRVGFGGGSLAGIMGNIVFLAVFVIVGVLVGADPTEPEGLVIRHPDIRGARIAENSLYLLALVLWTPHVLALYRKLRQTRLASAYFGGVVGTFGLVLLAAGALVHAATDPISSLYHAPGTTPEDQATLVLIWQATHGIYEALLEAGLLLAPTGIIGLEIATFGAPQFGRGVGMFSLGLGIFGLLAAVSLLFSVTPVAVVTVLSIIAFHLRIGWKFARFTSSFDVQNEGARFGTGVLVDAK